VRSITTAKAHLVGVLIFNITADEGTVELFVLLATLQGGAEGVTIAQLSISPKIFD